MCLVDCPTHIAWYAKSCFLYNLCAFSSVLGRNLLSGNVNLFVNFVLSVSCVINLKKRWFNYVTNRNLEQARAVSTDGLRPSFLTINAVVYAVQVKFLNHYFTRCPGEWGFWSWILTHWKQAVIHDSGIVIILMLLDSFGHSLKQFLEWSVIWW